MALGIVLLASAEKQGNLTNETASDDGRYITARNLEDRVIQRPKCQLKQQTKKKKEEGSNDRNQNNFT
ncbi:hypothetical protein [Nostoc sp.]|uniref:hypothetical protein n=1 Tax=Nostoc sp. TaxID=1180 RepID=UPI002FFBF9D4